MKLSDLDKKGVGYSIGLDVTGGASEAPAAPQLSGFDRSSNAARSFGDNLIKGAVKGLGSTLENSDELFRKVPLLGKVYTAIAPPPLAALNKKLGISTEARGVAQNIGKGAEQLGEFLIPDAAAGKAVEAYKGVTAASKLPKIAESALNLGARMVADGVAVGVTRTAQTGSPATGAKEGVFGGITSGVMHGVLSGLKGLAKYQPQVAEFLSGVDQKVFQRQLEDPAKAKAALQAAKEQGTEGVLRHVQRTVYDARKELTDSWKVGSQALTDAYTGVRTGLTQSETKLLSRLQDMHPTLEGAVTDPKSFSVKEGLELYKRVNEVVGHGSTPEEVTSRAVRDIVKRRLVTAFDSKQSASITKFLRDYADTKQALDGIDSLVSAYKTGNPKAQATAQRMIQNVFNKNQTAYLNAFQEFAKKAGFDHTDILAALNARQVLPMKSLGNGDFSTSLLRSVLAPAGSSPRASAAISRVLGNMLRGQGPLGAAGKVVDRTAGYLAGTASGE